MQKQIPISYNQLIEKIHINTNNNNINVRALGSNLNLVTNVKF
jgi:hypothetical protein